MHFESILKMIFKKMLLDLLILGEISEILVVIDIIRSHLEIISTFFLQHSDIKAFDRNWYEIKTLF